MREKFQKFQPRNKYKKKAHQKENILSKITQKMQMIHNYNIYKSL